MIISVEEAKKYITTTLDDSVLEGKLQALELLVRRYTNNNFQKRGFRFLCDIDIGEISPVAVSMFEVGDTIQISESELNAGIYVIKALENNAITVEGHLYDEEEVLVTKVEYPMDVKMGVVNMLKWDLENRDKVGIQSETISRHAVTYFNMDGENSTMGFPKSLLGFLKTYKKARF